MSLKTSKFMMHISNVLLLVGGLAAVAAGACWVLKVKVIVDFFGRNNYMLPNVLMVAGGCAAVVSCMGFYGTVKHSMCVLIVFVILTVLLLIGDIACVVLVYVKISWFDKQLKDNSSPKNFQLYFSALVGGIGACEIIALVFACLLVNKIKKIRKEEQ